LIYGGHGYDRQSSIPAATGYDRIDFKGRLRCRQPSDQPSSRARSIGIRFGDGKTRAFWERNLRFMTDSSVRRDRKLGRPQSCRRGDGAIVRR
jgi:hypothetical protein